MSRSRTGRASKPAKSSAKRSGGKKPRPASAKPQGTRGTSPRTESPRPIGAGSYPASKHPHDMTTDEAVTHLFHTEVVDHAKRRLSDAERRANEFVDERSEEHTSELQSRENLV